MAEAVSSDPVGEVLARLAKLDPIAQRSSFFEALAAFPPQSRERSDLALLGRAWFAPGPYAHDEFEVLHPELLMGERVQPPEEVARLDAHARAYAARLAASDRYQEASAALKAAQGARREGSDHSDRPGRTFSAVQQAAIDRCAELVDETKAEWQAASAAEVAARPHNARLRQRPASARPKFSWGGFLRGRDE